MKRNIKILLLCLFAFTMTACIQVPVAVSPQSTGYEDQYGSVYDAYGSGYGDEYVDVPIVYGEPYYVTPPVIVTYPYDYYTYEMVGGYVDIVFWRDGRRYRHERWMHQGRFVSEADMRSRQWHQKIRVTELSRHREKLRQNHNIYHPDSYYGMKVRPKQEIQQRHQQMEQRPQWQQQNPQHVEQKPEFGQQNQQSQRLPQRVQEQPQQLKQKPQLGQQAPQKTRQSYQQEQQKIRQERQRKTKERYKKPEQEPNREPETTKDHRNNNRERR